MKKRIVTILILALCCCHLTAQEEEGAVYQFDTIVNKKKSLQVIGLPVLFFTPETSFGFGAGAQMFLLKQSNVYNSRLSNIFVNAIYTAKNQFVIDLKPQIYFGKGEYFFDMAYKFKIFPNSFWGIGGDTPEGNKEVYNMTSSEWTVAFLKRLPPSLNFGFQYILNIHKVTEVEEDGILDSGTVLGSDRAVINGLGVIFNLDSRDDVASPTEGHFLQLNARFSSENFGATSGFNKFITDLRTYVSVGEKGTLALQLYSENTFGDAPFQGLAWYGGSERARGYFRGRFIDNHQYVGQAEYRYRFKPRWVLAGFALFGEVTDQPANFFNNIKPSFGGGIRFQLSKTQSTLLRLDFGIGLEGSNGFYFGVNEAF